MVRFIRSKTTPNIDLLETDNLELRKGFTVSACTIGRFSAAGKNVTAHILHLSPFLIGTITEENSGIFFPESPNYNNLSVQCELKIRDLPSKYSVFECENLNGAIFNLDVAYPKIVEKENPVVLGFDQGEKVVSTGFDIVGGVVTKLGTNEIYAVVGENGVVNVDQFKEVYEKAVWPIAKLYYRPVRSHYFTYFREYEVKYNLKHSGLQGTRYRHIEGNIYWSIYRARTWASIKSFFGC